MPHVPFDQLPDDARLWVFAADRDMNAVEQGALLGTVDAFLGTWAAHGAPLTCGRDFRYERFLLVAVDERSAGVSGCSIDALTRQLRDLETGLGLALLDNGPVNFREGDTIRRVARPEFRRLAATGAVSTATVVFDNTASTVGGLREGRWETAAAKTWVGRSFFG